MSVLLYNPCDGEIEDPISTPCFDDLEKGKVRSVGFIHKTVVDLIKADPTNPAVWEEAKESKLCYVIPEVIGTFDGGAPVESAGYGDQSTRLSGYNFAANYRDPNYKENSPFYDSIKGARNWHFVFRTDTQTHISDKPAAIIPKNPVEEDINTDVVWNVDVKWAQKGLVTPFDTPDAVFVSPGF